MLNFNQGLLPTGEYSGLRTNRKALISISERAPLSTSPAVSSQRVCLTFIHSSFVSSRISTTTQRPSNDIALIVQNLSYILQRNGVLSSLVNTVQFALLVPPIASPCHIQALICSHASLWLDEVVFLCFAHPLAYLQRCYPPQRDRKLQVATVSVSKHLSKQPFFCRMVAVASQREGQS
jgi:hypothetical protein